MDAGEPGFGALLRVAIGEICKTPGEAGEHGDAGGQIPPPEGAAAAAREWGTLSAFEIRFRCRLVEFRGNGFPRAAARPVRGRLLDILLRRFRGKPVLWRVLVCRGFASTVPGDR